MLSGSCAFLGDTTACLSFKTDIATCRDLDTSTKTHTLIMSLPCNESCPKNFVKSNSPHTAYSVATKPPCCYFFCTPAHNVLNQSLHPHKVDLGVIELHALNLFSSFQMIIIGYPTQLSFWALALDSPVRGMGKLRENGGMEKYHLWNGREHQGSSHKLPSSCTPSKQGNLIPLSLLGSSVVTGRKIREFMTPDQF